MPTGVYYDLPAGANTAQEADARVFGYDAEVQAKFFTQEFVVNGSDFTPLPFNSSVIVGGTTYYLVDESNTQDAGGGMVRWTRTYYQKPPDRSEYENIVYNYTLVYVRDIDSGLWISFPLGASFPLQVATRVDYKYYTTDDPANDIPTNKGWKIFKIDNAICTQGTNPVSGTVPNLAITSPYLGEDSEVTRWKGDIWVRKQRWVPYPEVNVEVIVA